MATLLRNITRSISNQSHFGGKSGGIKAWQPISEDEVSAKVEQANGFRTLPEVRALRLSDESIAPYSLPEEVLSFDSSHLVHHVYSNGDRERKIYCNVPLDDKEQENLRKLQDEANRQGLALMPSLSAASLRFLYDKKASGDVNKAIDSIKHTQDWRLSYFKEPLDPISDAELAADLQLGIVYWAGRDSDLRPTLVFRARRIPAAWFKQSRFDRVVKLFIFCVEYGLRYMLCPGRVENFATIIDLAGIGLMQVPVTVLKELHKSMAGHYCGRLFRFYICNMSFCLRSLVSVAKTILSERQVLKLHFVKDVVDLRQHYALHQLEADLGGTMPVLTDKFFPWALQPGPFEAGYTLGPGRDRVPNIHSVLSPAGSQGRLWDDSLDTAANTKLEFSSAAAEILQACQHPLPQQVLRDIKSSCIQLPPPEEAEPATTDACSAASGGDLEDMERDDTTSMKAACPTENLTDADRLRSSRSVTSDACERIAIGTSNTMQELRGLPAPIMESTSAPPQTLCSFGWWPNC
eukprot:TRINITY_DN15037_c0_g1_i1.p1 TRINITY_DN15037_c0_g1~~TRINITY_DN15037_c0_g1_i1.p1  ORF type:complete len:531 (-),score=99.98 TRINITY_DN15037_c0_g1_i1:56-1618(-)